MSPAQPVVLAIQNDLIDPPRLVGEWLAECGIRVDVIAAYEGQIVPTEVPEGVHGVVALGGGMGAGDDLLAPWLPAERELLANAVERDVPVLGLCLGGQLLASAMGGRVERAATPEIGVIHVRPTVDGLRDVVMSQARQSPGPDIPATAWHQDEVTQLPEGAVLLLTNETCRVQSFRVGDVGYGLQMHAEADGAGVRVWAELPDETAVRSGINPHDAADAVAEAEAELGAAWRPMTRAWGDLVWARFGSVVPA